MKNRILLSTIMITIMAGITACGSKPAEPEVAVQEVVEVEENKVDDPEPEEVSKFVDEEVKEDDEVTETAETEASSDDEVQEENQVNPEVKHPVIFKRQSDGTCVGEVWDFIYLDPSEVFKNTENFVYSGPESDGNIAIKPGDIVHGDGVSCDGEFEVVSTFDVIDYYLEIEGAFDFDDIILMDETGHPTLINKPNGATAERVLPVGIKTPEGRYYMIDIKCRGIDPVNVDWYVTTDWGRLGRTNPRELTFTIADETEIDVEAFSMSGNRAEFDENGEKKEKIISKEQFLDIPIHDWESDSEDTLPNDFEINGVEYFTPSQPLWAIGMFDGDTCTYLNFLYSP